MRGARPGVPKWRALPLKKKSTNHRPERGSNPGHEGPWSYYLPITPHYLTTTKNGLCIKPGPVKGLGGIALLIILHKVIKNGLSIEPGPVKGLGGIALLITLHHKKKKLAKWIRSTVLYALQ